MYSFNSRVRFSETDIDKKLSITGLMNYLQDCSIFQSEDVGAGFAYMDLQLKNFSRSYRMKTIFHP